MAHPFQKALIIKSTWLSCLFVLGPNQADLPFRRISAMFGVSNFIVSQVNFHVVPFLHKAHSPSEKSRYWKIFRLLDMDIRYVMGMFPTLL